MNSEPATTTARRVAVSEVFGPTIQGEGPSAGRPAVFLRLAGCNLACRWCDTPYTWDWTGISDVARLERDGDGFDPKAEMEPTDTADVAARIDDILTPDTMIVVTGGEPLNQQPAIIDVLGRIDADHARTGWARPTGGWFRHRVEVETNGTIPPDDRLAERVDQWNVSPKLAHSGDPHAVRHKPDAIAALNATDRAVWKFVARNADDVAEVADEWADPYGLSPVWIMPEGRDAPSVVRSMGRIADEVVARGWNLTTRLHILAWGDRRGV